MDQDEQAIRSVVTTWMEASAAKAAPPEIYRACSN